MTSLQTRRHACEMKMLVILQLFCVFTSTSGTQVNLLFFASAGGRGLGRGFYSGEFSLASADGSPRNIFKIDYDCLETQSNAAVSAGQGFIVKGVSLDAVTNTALVQVGYLTHDQLTLFRVPLCKRAAGTCADTLQLLLSDMRVYTHHVAAFASYDDQVYFITEQTVAIPGSGARRKRIELRHLSGCNARLNFPYTAGSAFYMDSCTSLVASIVDEEFELKSKYYTTAGLAIVPTKKGLVFYTQIQRFPTHRQHTNINISMDAFILMRVTSRRVDILHEEYVTSEHRKYIVAGLGQVTVRDSLLCWSALDRIVCAKLDNRGSISHARRVTNTRDVTAVCRGSSGDSLIGRIVTGVAIAQVPANINTDTLSVYFGCISQSRGQGGAALLRKRGAAPASVRPLRTNSRALYAGSMFTTDVCSTEDVASEVKVINHSVQPRVTGIHTLLITGTLLLLL